MSRRCGSNPAARSRSREWLLSALSRSSVGDRRRPVLSREQPFSLWRQANVMAGWGPHMPRRESSSPALPRTAHACRRHREIPGNDPKPLVIARHMCRSQGVNCSSRGRIVPKPVTELAARRPCVDGGGCLVARTKWIAAFHTSCGSWLSRRRALPRRRCRPGPRISTRRLGRVAVEPPG